MRQFMISFKTNCRDNDKCSRERNHFCLHIEEGWKQELLEIDDLWVWNQPTGLFNWKFLVIIFFFSCCGGGCVLFACLFGHLKKKKEEEVANIKNGENAASSPGRSFQTKLFIVEIWENRVKKEHPTQAFLPTVQSCVKRISLLLYPSTASMGIYIPSFLPSKLLWTTTSKPTDSPREWFFDYSPLWNGWHWCSLIPRSPATQFTTCLIFSVLS